MKVLEVIMAHRDAQETFDRHLPVWLSLGLDMLVFCPEDSQVKTDLPMFTFGYACHHGPHSIERFRNLLLHLEKTDYDAFLVQEYDSFSLKSPAPPGPMVIQCNLFKTDNDIAWMGDAFTHPPLFFARSTLSRIIAASGIVSDHAERSFWDRWLGLVAKMGAIQLSGWFGFSQNTIEPNQIEHAVFAVKGGARHLHGCKTKACFDAIMEAVNGAA